jgi:hypothetical protein
MKTYRIFKLTSLWSTDRLIREVEQLLNEKTGDGYEIVNVSFGVNMYWLPTAYVTICKHVL